MLHGADKGFIESGKYGKPGKYFLGFLKKENPWLDQGFS